MSGASRSITRHLARSRAVDLIAKASGAARAGSITSVFVLSSPGFFRVSWDV